MDSERETMTMIMIVFHSNFLSGMHGFRDYKVLLQAGYDAIKINLPGAHHAILYDGFWKSDHDFLIVFHSNFLSGMHAYRDNEVLLQGGYDVIVISTPWGDASDEFWWLILK